MQEYLHFSKWKINISESFFPEFLQYVDASKKCLVEGKLPGTSEIMTWRKVFTLLSKKIYSCFPVACLDTY